PLKGAEQPVTELVVCETASGLRLLHRAVPETKNTDEDIAALLAAAKDGIKRHAEKIEQVVAVPPFVSNDLGYQFEHMKAACATRPAARRPPRPTRRPTRRGSPNSPASTATWGTGRRRSRSSTRASCSTPSSPS